MSSKKVITERGIILPPKGLRGFLSETPIKPKSTIEVNGTTHLVVSSSLLEFTLFSAVGKISISHGCERIGDPAKVRSFLSDCGYLNKGLFLRRFFMKPVIQGTRAIVTLYCCWFDEKPYI